MALTVVGHGVAGSAVYAGSAGGATAPVVFSATVRVVGSVTLASSLTVSGVLRVSTLYASTAFGLGVSATVRQAHIGGPVLPVSLVSIVSAMLRVLEVFGFVASL